MRARPLHQQLAQAMIPRTDPCDDGDGNYLPQKIVARDHQVEVLSFVLLHPLQQVVPSSILASVRKFVEDRPLQVAFLGLEVLQRACRSCH